LIVGFTATRLLKFATIVCNAIGWWALPGILKTNRLHPQLPTKPIAVTYKLNNKLRVHEKNNVSMLPIAPIGLFSFFSKLY
jgi:hypothetical protein